MTRLAARLGLSMLAACISQAEAPAAKIGPVRYCIAPPAFARELGISMPAFSTTHRSRMGLLLYDGSKLDSAGGFAAPPYQDPSWQSAGWLGPIALDRAGNLYTAPVPHVSLLSNPLSEQNTLLKVGTIDHTLTKFLQLPVRSSPSAQNPFGIVGLTYDCDTDVLYVTTLSGSTEEQELGSAFAVSLKTNKIIDELPNADALGVAVFNSPAGKELYLGSARRGELLKQALSPEGKFIGRPSAFLNFDKYNETRARKITIDPTLMMQIEAVEFNYNLIATTELTQRSYRYHFSRSDKVWRAD